MLFRSVDKKKYTVGKSWTVKFGYRLTTHTNYKNLKDRMEALLETKDYLTTIKNADGIFLNTNLYFVTQGKGVYYEGRFWNEDVRNVNLGRFVKADVQSANSKGRIRS